MTIVDETFENDKYHHILLAEYYEFLGRIAFKYYDLLKAEGEFIPKERPR